MVVGLVGAPPRSSQDLKDLQESSQGAQILTFNYPITKITRLLNLLIPSPVTQDLKDLQESSQGAQIFDFQLPDYQITRLLNLLVIPRSKGLTGIIPRAQILTFQLPNLLIPPRSSQDLKDLQES
jgi:hypothetical protein